MVVLPELSRPMIMIFNYFLPDSFENIAPNIEPICFCLNHKIILTFHIIKKLFSWSTWQKCYSVKIKFKK